MSQKACKTKSLSSLLLALLMLFALASAREAHADGISLEEFDLEELVRGSSQALLVTTGSYDSKSGDFPVTIKKVWTMPSKAATFVAGAKETMRFMERNESVPGKWVIVRQYWDAQGSNAIKKGNELVLFPQSYQGGSEVDTIVFATASFQRKLDMVFQANWEKEYERTSSAQLKLDLADYDLFKRAYALLSKRRALSTPALLEAARQKTQHDPFGYHVEKLGKKRGVFLEEAAKQSAKAGGHLVELLRRYFASGSTLAPRDIKALTIYLQGLDFQDKDHVDSCYYLNHTILRYLESKAGKGESKKFLPYFIRYTPRRSDGGGSEEQISQYVKLLSSKERIRLATGLMPAIEASAHDAVDTLSLKIVSESFAKLPSKRVLAFLTRVQPLINPDGFDGCNQVSLMVQATIGLSKPASPKSPLQSLSRALVPMYHCNVEADLMQGLKRLAK